MNDCFTGPQFNSSFAFFWAASFSNTVDTSKKIRIAEKKGNLLNFDVLNFYFLSLSLSLFFFLLASKITTHPMHKIVGFEKYPMIQKNVKERTTF